ncbi:uncharacterized protein BO72DRAFT_162163 [Aspergillus fijiensis CBS 313.89]|uniref:Uncharacterized protein n=1 Tax=Aspergillus fijiensis CBS 313.89 TaxID=1448319 RepID=A0A8G1RMQ6_9EURO|nr:uncharacterized protein BO72DRAFT_162163 [Aspergillus fijiensis CBS 313.89]RAK75599.1 hypothetical protein BO72DRAFT_162163 [Aspergillus fijiensis CBS 313.89]
MLEGHISMPHVWSVCTQRGRRTAATPPCGSATHRNAEGHLEIVLAAGQERGGAAAVGCCWLLLTGTTTTTTTAAAAAASSLAPKHPPPPPPICPLNCPCCFATSPSGRAPLADSFLFSFFISVSSFLLGRIMRAP